MIKHLLPGATAVVLLLLLGACVRLAPDRLTLAASSFAALPGWQEDDLGPALAAFLRSCAIIAGKPPETALGVAGTAADWQAACAKAATVDAGDPAAVHRYFAGTFAPYEAGNNGNDRGLFTGYYEPLLRGAREPGGPYTVPLRHRPPDLVMVDLGLFRPAWRGERIAGRVVDGRLQPYESRTMIESGALDRYGLAFLWVDDPVDAFFLEIQGSGRVELPDGSQVRVGYDGQNGQPYVAIGRLLVERGILERDAVSMQSIRAWIKSNPEAGAALMAENPSYVFFRESEGDGPIGAEGAVLTPGRSLAVDRSFVPLGVPIWLDAGEGADRIQRLMIAQDTGGAIRGPVRGDVFWGFGPEAEARAGTMKAEGTCYLLLPKTVPIVGSMQTSAAPHSPPLPN
jgi:membrane-bound lytic murein transglycosylase A